MTPAPPDPLQDCIVLLVEDEWLVRMELSQAFEDEGCVIRESSSAEDALAVLQTGEPIDLLLTDVRLTGRMNGWELAATARNARPELAVIYLSANPPSPDRYVEGAVFIDKPALMEKVIAVARQLLAAGGASL